MMKNAPISQSSANPTRAGLDYESSFGKKHPNDTISKLQRTRQYCKRIRAHVCSFFIKGECTRGDECPYRHEMPETGELSQQKSIKDHYYGHMFCSSSSLSTGESREVPYLPDELLLNCFARVSRSYYPSLSLVSKRFRSLLASKELYKTRKLLGTTESCLYLVLGSDSSSCGSWFTLCRRPTRPILGCFLRPWKNIMVSVPTHKLPLTTWATPTAVGSDVYMIGGFMDGEPSSTVFVLDCLSHTWHEAPSLRVARMNPLVTVVDETIYVMEHSPNGHSQDVIEFFDTKTKIWETLPSPGAEIGITGSSAVNGNLYLFGNKKNVVYKPKEKKWYAVGSEVCLPDVRSSTCVVDNVSYSYSGRQLKWWDSKSLDSLGLSGSWRALKGHLRNLDKGFQFVELVNYNGKIAVFWETNVFAKEKRKIWCAEVTLEKRNNGQEIRGKVSRRDVVLTVPKSSSFPKTSTFGHFIVSTV